MRRWPQPGSRDGRLLGGVVRSVPGDRAGPRADRRSLGRPGDVDEGQRRREPRAGGSVRYPIDPDGPVREAGHDRRPDRRCGTQGAGAGRRERTSRLACESPCSDRAGSADITVRFARKRGTTSRSSRVARTWRRCKDAASKRSAPSLAPGRCSWAWSRAVIPHMQRQGGGSIVNIGSVLGLKAALAFPVHPYAVAKAGVAMLTKTIAVHYAKDGIRCNCVAPAVTETPLLESRLKDAAVRTAMEARVPLGRLGSPDDVAQAALYLASDDATWTTGTILTVDGGIMAQ